MSRYKSIGPTERELDILRVLWQYPSLSVREVHQHLEHLELSFTTIQTMLNVMFEKDIVKRKLSGRTLIYSAKVSQQQAEDNIVGDVLERVFGGSAKALLARALGVKKASKKELKEIQQLLQQAKKEQ